MKKIDLYTDGACSGNPGAGGWAAILKYGEREKEISGFVRETTNNRMEMFAVIMGLASLKEACEVTVYSDSAYLISAFNQGWVDKWQRNGWISTSKEAVKNQDLWRDLLSKASPHNICWVKVKGHSDNEYNNRCDALAVGEINSNK